jgi:hypothetical protein
MRFNERGMIGDNSPPWRRHLSAINTTNQKFFNAPVVLASPPDSPHHSKVIDHKDSHSHINPSPM